MEADRACNFILNTYKRPEGANSATAVGRITLFKFEIEKVILDFFFGEFVWRLVVEPSHSSNRRKIGLLCVTRKIVKFHYPDHLLT